MGIGSSSRHLEAERSYRPRPSLRLVAWEPLLWALGVLGALAFAASIASLVDGVRFRARVLAERVWDHNAFVQPALVLIPCRGADEGFEANLEAILYQDYPSYRVVLCVDSADDPAIEVIERVRARHRLACDIALAKSAPGMGGKALALLGGLETRTTSEDILVFLDADVRPDPRFLRSLVQPLAHPEVGATTGYRWYVPVQGGFWSAVRSAWNAVGLNVFFSNRYNFLWGGAWAIRRENLDRLDLGTLWQGTLSEDLAITAAIKAMELRVHYVPQAVMPTFEDCDRAGCVEWTTRQTAMVAVWGRHIRNFAALTYGVFTGAFVLGILCVVLALIANPFFIIPAALFLFNIPATVAKGEYRRQSVFLGSPELAIPSRVSPPIWAIANLIVPWLILVNLARTRQVRRIEWRGKAYRVTADGLEGTDHRT